MRRSRTQRIGVVEVRQARQRRRDDAQGAIGGASGAIVRRYRCGVLRRQPPGRGQPVDETEARPPGAPFDAREAVREQRRIAPELVHGETDDQGRVLRIQDRPRADQGRDHAAAVDVADEADGDAGRPREAHVGNVVRPQGADHASLHDDLGAPVGLRLQEHRVEVAVRLHSGGARLQRLRAADLAAVGADCGVVGHVLRL